MNCNISINLCSQQQPPSRNHEYMQNKKQKPETPSIIAFAPNTTITLSQIDCNALKLKAPSQRITLLERQLEKLQTRCV